MKIVYYIDNAEGALPVAVSAWSVKARGNLPTLSKYILYTDDESNFENPLLQKVFDDVQYTPYDKEWFDSIPWDKFPCGNDPGNIVEPVEVSAFGDNTEGMREFVSAHRSRKKFWSRFASFLHTPCEGDPVLQLDWDMLCLSNIAGVYPPYPYTWSCYKNCAYSHNNGFTLKTPEFDRLGGSECMLEPLNDPEKYELAFQLHPSGDEVGPAWYELSRGSDDVWCVDSSYNYSAGYAMDHDIDVGRMGVKLLHYGYLTKPWQKYVNQNSPVVRLWWDTMREMCLDLKEEVPDVRLSS